MGAYSQFAATSQFYLYGRRHFTRTGYNRAKKALQSAGLFDADGIAAGQVFIVTGANSGVGMEVSLFLAKKGATVHMVCRSEKRGEQARSEIVEQSGNSRVVLHVCDCSLGSDVRTMWSEFARSESRLDGLVCNAGVLLNERTMTSEGIETTFACHLLFGTYLLGSLAMPLLEATEGSRMVAVSSGGMYNTKFPEWDVATAQQPDEYSGNLAYAYAKRGQVLLCERWSVEHPTVRFVSCHPGWTLTPAVDAAYGDAKRYLEPMRSPWEGAEGIAWLCVAPAEQLQQGAFYLDGKVEPKHLAGPFFTEGKLTKNTEAEVDTMMAKLGAWATGDLEASPAEAGVAARRRPLRERSEPVDVGRFMGRWFVIAAIPTFVDKGAVNSIEEYTWNEQKQRVEVAFKMQASFSAPVKEYPQRATIANVGVGTKWSLSPQLAGVYLPLGLSYLIVDCADDYSTTIVGAPDRSFLYVMARTPSVDASLLDELLSKCERIGYDLSKVQLVAHEGAAPAAMPAALVPKPKRMDVPRSLPGTPFDGPPRLCMATMTPSHNGASAKRVLDAITEAAPDRFATWFALFPRATSSPYYAWVEALKSELPDEQRAAYASRYGWSAPFVWLELPDGTRHAIGGRDELCAWARTELADLPAVVTAAGLPLRYADVFLSVAKDGSASAPA